MWSVVPCLNDACVLLLLQCTVNIQSFFEGNQNVIGRTDNFF